MFQGWLCPLELPQPKETSLWSSWSAAAAPDRALWGSFLPDRSSDRLTGTYSTADRAEGPAHRGSNSGQKQVAMNPGDEGHIGADTEPSFPSILF